MPILSSSSCFVINLDIAYFLISHFLHYYDIYQRDILKSFIYCWTFKLKMWSYTYFTYSPYRVRQKHSFICTIQIFLKIKIGAEIYIKDIKSNYIYEL